MDMNIVTAAVSEAQNLLKNKIVLEFLRNEALEKVSCEMQAMGYSCTAKGVDVLSIRHKNIEDRVQQYIAIGAVACLMAKYQRKAN